MNNEKDKYTLSFVGGELFKKSTSGMWYGNLQDIYKEIFTHN